MFKITLTLAEREIIDKVIETDLGGASAELHTKEDKEYKFPNKHSAYAFVGFMEVYTIYWPKDLYNKVQILKKEIKNYTR